MEYKNNIFKVIKENNDTSGIVQWENVSRNAPCKDIFNQKKNKQTNSNSPMTLLTVLKNVLKEK